MHAIGLKGACGIVHNDRRIVGLGYGFELWANILIRDHFVGVGRLSLLGARGTRHISDRGVLGKQERSGKQDGGNRYGKAREFSDSHFISPRKRPLIPSLRRTGHQVSLSGDKTHVTDMEVLFVDN